MSSSAEKKYTLKSFDSKLTEEWAGAEFEVNEAVVRQSLTLSQMIADDCEAELFPLHNVNSKMLAKIIEYCNRHVDVTAEAEAELKAWDDEFVNVDLHTLFELMLAADYLEITKLVDLICQTVAKMIKGKGSEEIVQIFNIKNDFTEKESKQVFRRSRWAYK